jgi:hypothetical protein
LDACSWSLQLELPLVCLHNVIEGFHLFRKFALCACCNLRLEVALEPAIVACRWSLLESELGIKAFSQSLQFELAVGAESVERSFETAINFFVCLQQKFASNVSSSLGLKFRLVVGACNHKRDLHL